MNVDYSCRLLDLYFTYSKVFPIFLVKNFITIDDVYKNKLKIVIKENMDHHYNIMGKGGYNFPIVYSFDDFFVDIYDKFYNLSTKIFGTLTPTVDCSGCHSYVTDHNGFGVNKLHNHLQTSTISACYYLNIPKQSNCDESSISFISWETNTELIYRPSNFDLIIFPNYLDHKINYSPYEDERITITMEIQCEEESTNIFQTPFIENESLKYENEENLFKYYKKILL
jgi:hypothetical protein